MVLNDSGAGNVAALRDTRGTLALLPGAAGVSTAGGSAPARVGLRQRRPGARRQREGDRPARELAGGAGRRDRHTDDQRLARSDAVRLCGDLQQPHRRQRGLGRRRGCEPVSAWRFDPSTGRAAGRQRRRGQRTERVLLGVDHARRAPCVRVERRQFKRQPLRDRRRRRARARRNRGAGTGSDSAPADSAVSANSRALYVRNGRSFTIASYAIDGRGPSRSGALRGRTAGDPPSALPRTEELRSRRVGACGVRLESQPFAAPARHLSRPSCGLPNGQGGAQGSTSASTGWMAQRPTAPGAAPSTLRALVQCEQQAGAVFPGHALPGLSGDRAFQRPQQVQARPGAAASDADVRLHGAERADCSSVVMPAVSTSPPTGAQVPCPCEFALIG